MIIEGLDKKPEPIIESIGVYKLKDKEGRNAVQIDFSKVKRPLTEARYLFIVKVPNSNNKIEVKVQWKPEDKKNEIPK